MRCTVGKVLDFPAAHSNAHHSGHCRNLHGHTWTLEIICRARVKEGGYEGNEEFGMVVDFGRIKEAYKERVEPFVEHQNLNETLDLPEYTTELIAAWIFKELRKSLPELHAIKLWEGKSSYAMIEEGDSIRA